MSSIFDPTEEKTNGTKIARLLVDGGTQALRNVLMSLIHPSSTLQIELNRNKATLSNLKTKKILNDSQWEKLFPSSGGPPDSGTFDITLLHLLLRTICVLTAPATGWNDFPTDTDHSREAHIVRIKCFRNDLCHGISTSVPSDEFKDKWNTISHSLVALGLDQLKIDRLRTENIDHDTQRRVEEEVQKWKLDFEPRMENIEEKVERLEEHMSSVSPPISEPSDIRELPNCLPDEVQDVFGRSEEIKRAVVAVQSGKVAIVSITGGPGFGKTTVANKVAHELAKPEYRRSVFCCSLASQAKLKDIATTMILTCSRSYSQLPDNPKTWLLNWSRQQLGKVTLVLDNADHVLESEDRQEFVNMLRDMRMYSRQNLTCIISSRNTISAHSGDLKIENIIINCLPLDEAANVLLSKIDNVEIRQKLCQKTKLVELCGCVPLALCIVGSLLSEFEEGRLIKSLEREPLNVLQDKGMSVEHAINTSFDLLSPTEKEALAIISVLPGSFDIDAAEAVIKAAINTEAELMVILRSLKNKSLLEQPSPHRYEIHQLVKVFLIKVSRAQYSKASAQAQKLACGHFISRLADNATLYWSTDKCKESVTAFNIDRHNFEYFLGICVDTMKKLNAGPLQASINYFFRNLPQKCMYLEMCLLPSFYVMILEKLLTYFSTIRQHVRQVEVLCLLGHEKRKIGDHEQYKVRMEQAKEAYFKNYPDFEVNGMSQVLFFNSYALFLGSQQQHSRREIEKVREQVFNFQEKASEVCRKKLDKHPETATTLLLIGRYRKSMPHLQEAMDLFKHCLGEHFMTAQCHKAIADFYFSQDNTYEIDKCFKHYGAALAMMSSLGVGDHKESILTLKNYGLCHKFRGNYEEAINLLTKAEHVAEIELEENHRWKVMIETQLALLHDFIGNVEEARTCMRKGLEMRERLKQPISELRKEKEIKEFLGRYPDLSHFRTRLMSGK